MKSHRCGSGVWIMVLATLGSHAIASPALANDEPTKQDRPAAGRKLSHDETLRWIAEHRAWKPARKTRPIWARPVRREEIGKEFMTADHVKEVAREGYWLCVGVGGEPWFQTREKIDSKYEPGVEEVKSFAFDAGAQMYRLFKPKGDTRNWVAQVKGPGIEGFSIKPGYDPERPLYSPGGGYVVKDYVEDPYRDKPRDIWLVQQSLFESTYSLIPESDQEAPRP